jgi:Flp pilus assembly protein CpaB
MSAVTDKSASTLRESSTSDKSSASVDSQGQGLNYQVIGSILLMLVLAIAGKVAFDSARGRIPALVAARSLDPGVVIEQADVRVEEFAGSNGIDYIPASRRSEIIGKIATQPIYLGQLLSRRALAGLPSFGTGFGAMSLALKPEQAAGGAVGAGDHVEVIRLASPDRPEDRSVRLFEDVTVLWVRRTDSLDGTLIVTLKLRPDERLLLADARAAGSIELVLISQGTTAR